MSDSPLIGRGRTADVFDLGDGRVLRRYRNALAGSVEAEAVAMRHLREHGAPVPEVFSADGTDLVMGRLNGPTMLDAMKSKPWRAAAIGRELSALHTRIHRIPAGDLPLRRFSEGDAILHFDLHPDNVILTAIGPMIIDWSNVALGDPLADVMNTWMVMVTSSPDDVPRLVRPVVGRVRRALTEGFIESTPFAPDERMRAILVDAAAVANGTARALVFSARDPEVFLFANRQWKTGFLGGDYRWLTDDGAGGRNLDDRTLFFYVATVNTPAMALKMPGVGSQYAIIEHDGNGRYLDGAARYELTLPRTCPPRISGPSSSMTPRRARNCRAASRTPASTARGIRSCTTRMARSH